MGNNVTANLELVLYGKPVKLSLDLPTEPVKPIRMLPVFHKITNQFVDTAVEAFVGENETISCQAGCGACCRQPVPLAEFEAYQIAELVDNLPESRRTKVKNKFAEACEKLENIEWSKRLSEVLNTPEAKEKIKKLALEYFSQGIACPFLEEESCSIHQNRPIACREYLVTSPAENCQNPTPENIDLIDLKFKTSEIVRNLWKTQNLPDRNFITMIYALEFVSNHPDKFGRKRGEEWLKEFFGYLGKQ